MVVVVGEKVTDTQAEAVEDVIVQRLLSGCRLSPSAHRLPRNTSSSPSPLPPLADRDGGRRCGVRPPFPPPFAFIDSARGEGRGEEGE